VCRLRRGHGNEADALRYPSVRGVVHQRVAKRQLGFLPPDARSALAERKRVVRRGQFAPQHLLDGQFGQDQVRGNPREMEQQRLDAETSFT
jgi:hypothetical protein